MKISHTAAILALLLALSSPAGARGGGGHSSSSGTGSSSSSHSVEGYTTNRGTYVAPYHATNPNATQRDNYSATGNVNPYTGAVGSRAPQH